MFSFTNILDPRLMIPNLKENFNFKHFGFFFFFLKKKLFESCDLFVNILDQLVEKMDLKDNFDF